MKQKVTLVLALIVGLVLAGMLFVGMRMEPVVSPAQASFPTPQCCAFGGGDWAMANLMNAQSIMTTTKTCGSGQQTAAYVLADIQTVADLHTPDQAITCTIESSNDNVNWCTEVHTLTIVTTDTVACDEFHLFGRYTRACCESSSSTDRYTMTQRVKVFN